MGWRILDDFGSNVSFASSSNQIGQVLDDFEGLWLPPHHRRVSLASLSWIVFENVRETHGLDAPWKPSSQQGWRRREMRRGDFCPRSIR